MGAGSEQTIGRDIECVRERGVRVRERELATEREREEERGREVSFVSINGI